MSRMAEDHSVEFEYRAKHIESPFETFLRYTDEKEKSSGRLAAVLQEEESALHILDIGAGTGEYLALTLSKLKRLSNLRLVLLEPSADLARQIRGRFSTVLPLSRVTVVNADLAAFTTKERFDVVLASHLLYHIPRPIWPQQLQMMLSLLKPRGRLIIVAREKDDAYAFKMAFKPLLFNKEFQAVTLNDVLDVVPDKSHLHISRHLAASRLRVPLDTNLEDTITIIEFYLNKRWQDIPKPIQQDALQFIKDRAGVFEQLDGIAVIKADSREQQ